MLHTVPTIVPTLHGARRGRILPTRVGARAIVLIDKTAGNRRIRDAFTELSYYLHDAGWTVLLLPSSPADRDLQGGWVSILLGVVAYMRSLGSSRITLIQATHDLQAMGTREPLRELDGLFHAVGQQHATDEIVQAITSLTTAIREVADSVIGMATVITEPTENSTPCCPPAPAREREAGLDRYPVVWLGACDSIAPLLSRLYGWAMRLTDNERSLVSEVIARERDQCRDGSAPTLGADWGAWCARLEERWGELLGSLECRAPARARAARAAGAKHHAGGRWGVIQQARAAWSALDGMARRDWLTCCACAFASL